MGLLQAITDSIGGENLKRLAAGNVNLGDPNSPDMQHLQQMIKNVDPGQLQQILSKVAQQVDPQDYSDHVTPGTGGTNPLGSLRPRAGKHCGRAGQLPEEIRRQRRSERVAARRSAGFADDRSKGNGRGRCRGRARYAQANHPDAFGQAAMQIAQKQPACCTAFWERRPGRGCGGFGFALHQARPPLIGSPDQPMTKRSREGHDSQRGRLDRRKLWTSWCVRFCVSARFCLRPSRDESSPGGHFVEFAPPPVPLTADQLSPPT